MTENTVHIGFDDTDSTKKGCTTYIAALLVEKLEALQAKFLDYPNLIRLNPNVPWKTRGNGALCLRIQHARNMQDAIKETVIEVVEKHSDLSAKGTEPGIVFFEHAKIPRAFRFFAQNAITSIVTIKEAARLVSKHRAEAVGFKSGRGIIGALAAIGEPLENDHTYEVLAYRTPENCGSKRRIDETSIFEMDKRTSPYTFNNVDEEKNRIIITPRGPDPILFGIRGESPLVVKEAFEMVKPLEPVERWVIFRTNQGTDAHLKKICDLSMTKPYNSIIARGTVSAAPRMIPKRHVIFSIKDENAEVDCAAFEPTGCLRRFAQRLAVGDFLEISGSVRVYPATERLAVNLEKIRLLKAAASVVYRNPLCPACGKRLKSMGENQGLRCEKCGKRDLRLGKVPVKVVRDVKKGLYITSTRSQRHLTKPLRRYGFEKHGLSGVELIDGWHSV